MNTEFRNFQVRDISGYYDDEPTFDVVFHDDLQDCVRYSEQVFATYQEAVEFSEQCEVNKETPYHWDRCAT